MTDEKRREGSIRVQKPLEITYAANCPPIQARIEDISETGFFLDNTNNLHVDSELEFSLDLPDESGVRKIQGKGRVVWIQPTVGAGVEFLDLGPDDRAAIRFFVASVFFGHAD
jgi:Tfp pilus assembly protein PilZ